MRRQVDEQGIVAADEIMVYKRWRQVSVVRMSLKSPTR